MPPHIRVHLAHPDRRGGGSLERSEADWAALAAELPSLGVVVGP